VAIPTFKLGTEEFIAAEVASNVTLNTQTVTIHVKGEELAAEWIGTAGTTRQCRTSSKVVFDPNDDWADGLYPLAVKYIDTPEHPLIDAGYIRVKR
jgi:hypothetical protein